LDGFVLFQLSFQKYHDHHHYHFHHYLLMVLTRRRNVNKSTMNYLRYVVILVTLSTPFIRQKDAFTDNAQSRNITQLSPCQNYDKLMPNSSLVGTNLMLANALQLNSYTMLFYHVKHSRINPPSVPFEFKQRIHRLLIILIISGDISLDVSRLGIISKCVFLTYKWC
jgi:hypothetical protein